MGIIYIITNLNYVWSVCLYKGSFIYLAKFKLSGVVITTIGFSSLVYGDLNITEYLNPLLDSKELLSNFNLRFPLVKFPTPTLVYENIITPNLSNRHHLTFGYVPFKGLSPVYLKMIIGFVICGLIFSLIYSLSLIGEVILKIYTS
jgi:hypothetical protein